MQELELFFDSALFIIVFLHIVSNAYPSGRLLAFEISLKRLPILYGAFEIEFD